MLKLAFPWLVFQLPMFPGYWNAYIQTKWLFLWLQKTGWGLFARLMIFKVTYLTNVATSWDVIVALSKAQQLVVISAIVFFSLGRKWGSEQLIKQFSKCVFTVQEPWKSFLYQRHLHNEYFWVFGILSNFHVIAASVCRNECCGQQ